MQRVKCFLPNASDLISGIPFRQCADGGVESVDVLDDETAAQFSGINGYVLVPAEAPPSDETPTTKRTRAK